MRVSYNSMPGFAFSNSGLISSVKSFSSESLYVCQYSIVTFLPGAGVLVSADGLSVIAGAPVLLVSVLLPHAAILSARIADMTPIDTLLNVFIIFDCPPLISLHPYYGIWQR
jgi:hypothetical protein